MAMQIVRDAAVWFAEYNFTGSMNSLALSYSADLKDTTVLSDAGRRRLAGLPQVTAGLDGFWDSTLDLGAYTNVGLVDVPMTIGPVDNVEGSIAYAFAASGFEYELGGEVGEGFPFSVRAEGSAGLPLVRGTLMANKTVTVDGNGTAFQVGAVSSTQKVYAALHVLSVSAGDSIDVTLERDSTSGFPSPATHVTFSTKSAAGSEWATPVSGAQTDTWWRAVHNVTGAAVSIEFVVMMAIQ